MELENKLKEIFFQFKTTSNYKSYKTFNSGHINDTFLIQTDDKPCFVLQKINGRVFKKAKSVIKNKVKISTYLTNKNRKTPQYLTTKNNTNYIEDKDGNFWNLCSYIENSVTYLQVTSNKIAMEAGKVTGNFLADVNNFSGKLEEILPNFHNMTFRYSQFEKALLEASEERKKEAKIWIDFTNSSKEEMCALDRAISSNKIPLRVTHNDTKVSNILFDKNEKAICLIDLDTVMLGAVHFDFGDAIRTICNTTNEDEKDIDKIKFNLEYFKSYTQSFLASIKKNLTKNELEYLPISPKIITFIMGIRFLTDFLNNDLYYKINYTNHNLDRAKNQFTLVKEIKKQQPQITEFINAQY